MSILTGEHRSALLIWVPNLHMNHSLRLLTTVVVLAFASFIRADDFFSRTILSGQTFSFSHLRGGQFLIIRNFTQDDLVTTRGVVMVTKPPGTSANILSAANLAADPPDVINTVVIAGPADVSAMCGDTTGNCFISYRKGSN
jgi:hypothetical protein